MTNKKILYTCPMHSEIVRDRPGKCPKCGGMDLVPMGKKPGNSFITTYKPLFIILLLIFFVTFTISIKELIVGSFEFSKSMSYFMAGFFLIFSGFKLLDLKGFQSGYRTYDLLARKIGWYGLIYPFIELFFGIGYLLGLESEIFHTIVFLVMAFSGIGVTQKLLAKEKFQCVCLGTFIKVPLTKITFVEDFGMALMAILMVFVK